MHREAKWPVCLQWWHPSVSKIASSGGEQNSVECCISHQQNRVCFCWLRWPRNQMCIMSPHYHVIVMRSKWLLNLRWCYESEVLKKLTDFLTCLRSAYIQYVRLLEYSALFYKLLSLLTVSKPWSRIVLHPTSCWVIKSEPRVRCTLT